METETVSRKPGIVYLSSIPRGMNVSRVQEYFSRFARIKRVYLKPDERGKRKKKICVEFREGWIEFERKSAAKRVVFQTNGCAVSDRKGSGYYDTYWNVQYISGLTWDDLSEHLKLEQKTREKNSAKAEEEPETKKNRVRTKCKVAMKKMKRSKQDCSENSN